PAEYRIAMDAQVVRSRIVIYEPDHLVVIGRVRGDLLEHKRSGFVRTINRQTQPTATAMGEFGDEPERRARSAEKQHHEGGVDDENAARVAFEAIQEHDRGDQ